MPKPPYDWDTDKAVANLKKHGVRFEDVLEFQWSTAISREDRRYDYGETRWQAVGKIGEVPHVLVYTLRDGMIRIISLRKANKRERR